VFANAARYSKLEERMARFTLTCFNPNGTERYLKWW